MTAAADQDGRFIPAEAFVTTYSPPHGVDPVTLYEQYHRVRAFAADNPDLGSAAIANRLDIPRSRVRGWVDEQPPETPDCVRGLQIAEDRGWIDIDPNMDTFKGLNVLVASVFAGGSIAADTFSPIFAVGDGMEIDRLVAACRQVGVDATVERLNEHRRAAEVRPTADAAILGRALHALGAPIGRKAEIDLRLPSYLEHVDEPHRRAFARTYVHTRGSEAQWGRVNLKEERADSYLDELAAFLERTTGGTVYRSARNVVLQQDAVEALDG